MAVKIERPKFGQQVGIKQRHPDLRAVERPVVTRRLETMLFIYIVQDFGDEVGGGIFLSLQLFLRRSFKGRAREFDKWGRVLLRRLCQQYGGHHRALHLFGWIVRAFRQLGEFWLGERYG